MNVRQLILVLVWWSCCWCGDCNLRVLECLQRSGGLSGSSQVTSWDKRGKNNGKKWKLFARVCDSESTHLYLSGSSQLKSWDKEDKNNEKWFKSRHSCVTLELEWQLKKWPQVRGGGRLWAGHQEGRGPHPEFLWLIWWRWLPQRTVCSSILMENLIFQRGESDEMLWN